MFSNNYFDRANMWFVKNGSSFGSFYYQLEVVFDKYDFFILYLFLFLLTFAVILLLL